MKVQSEFKGRGKTMKKYKIAAIIMIIHGGFMELAGVLCMIPALLLGNDKFDIGKFFEFKLQYFQDNIYMMIVMGAIYGVIRLIGAIGLLKNRMWGGSAVGNHLHNNHYADDVFIASRHYGWNSCWKCIDIDFNGILWR